MTRQDYERNMVFQVLNDGKILTVHTEVGNGVTNVVIDVKEARDESEDSKDADSGKSGSTGE